MSDEKPPIAKYRLTVEITGNSHDEIEREIHVFANGGYLMDSGYYKRDEFDTVGGRLRARLEHVNPEMTPERYDAELMAWHDARVATRRADRSSS